MSHPHDIGAAQLRRNFDQSFASLPAAKATDQERILLVYCAAELLAIRCSQIARLLKLGRVVPLRSQIPELLGLTGVRGAAVPVFDLAPLLGLPGRAREPHWIVLVRSESPVAFAFDVLEGQVDVTHASIANGQQSAISPFLRQSVRAGFAMRPLVDLFAVVRVLDSKAAQTNSERRRDHDDRFV